MSEARRARLAARLDELEVDALLVTTPANRRWLAGFTGTTAVLVAGADCARIATDSRYWEQVATQCPGWELIRGRQRDLDSIAAPLFARLGGKRLGFEPANLTVAAHEQWQAAIESLPTADRPSLAPAPNAIEALRAVKEPEELDALTRAVELGDAAWAHAASAAAPGMTERELAWEVQRCALEHGADALSFDTIIAGGDWGALPHAYPRDVPLEAGAGVVMDLGVVVDGYCSDLTRTIFLGDGAPRAREQFARIYDIVLTAQTMAEERIEAGMTGHEAHQIAVEVIATAGYGDRFGHGLGHGVGLDIHEAPRLAPDSDEVLQDGHVVTVEPGIYLPGWGGVRIEDQCVMEGGRLRSLTTAPKLDLEGPR